MPRAAQFVVKISKFCNLRCSYCYEFEQLGDKTRMSLEQAERMFENTALEAERSAYESVSFVWHGGEPLLVKPEVYRQIGAIQKRVFEGRVAWWNTVQTNLTVLTDEWIAFLKNEGFFRGIGVSFDAYGDQRVDIRGRLRTDQTLRNMQRLLNAGIYFGGITVLAQNTKDKMPSIVRFYDGIHTPARLLPFYRAANAGQTNVHALTGEEIFKAMSEALDVWLGSESGVDLDPITDFLDIALLNMRGLGGRRYAKERDEQVFIVDVDGSTWGVSETYDPAYRYGNLFEEDFGRLLASQGRAKAVVAAEARMERHCSGCPLLGACPGWFVADATPEQEKALEGFGCVARAMVGRVIERLETAGLAEKIRAGERLMSERPMERQAAAGGI